MAGTDLYWGRGEDELRELAEALGHPGLPQRHRAAAACPPTTSSASRRARGAGLRAADVALVIGVPLDFRLGFGALDRRGGEADPCSTSRPTQLERNRQPELDLVGDIAATPRRDPRGGRRAERTAPDRALGRGSCAKVEEREARGRAGGARTTTRSPLHPMRIYRELGEVLDRDAIVIGDGGDFVSYAGRVVDTYEPGCWMDPGPVRLPRRRPRPGDRRQARPPRPPGLPAARRRRLRLLRDGVRHDGPPRAAASSA